MLLLSPSVVLPVSCSEQRLGRKRGAIARDRKEREN
jgi:hypothetical protein